MKKCFVVDDNEISRVLAASIVALNKIDVVELDSSEKAFILCQETMPDLMILDWVMPGLDGINFLKELRKLPDGIKPYVIICTSKNKIENVHEAVSAGANSYIIKPLRPEVLNKKLKETGII